MKTKHNKQLFRKLYFTAAICLILAWIGFSLLSINRVSLSVVTHPTKNIASDIEEKREIFDDHIFLGEFRAVDNNLGLIILELEPYMKTQGEEEFNVTFKFKGKGEKVWRVEKEYRSGLFDSQTVFSFGVPIISTSKNDIYVFEVYADSQEKHGNIKVKNAEYFITGYKYSINDLKNLDKLAFFLIGKFTGSFSDPYFLGRSLLHLIPVVLFLLGLFLLRKIKIKKGYLRITVPVSILAVALFYKYFANLGLFLLVALWALLVWSNKLKSRFSFKASFIIIVVWFAVIPFGSNDLQNKLNEWGYALLFFGCAQLLLEERKR